MAMLSKTLALCALSLPLAARAAQLMATHFSGTVYALDLSGDGALTVTSRLSGLQRIPAWITWDPASRTAYVSDESWFGPGTGTLAEYSLSPGGELAVTGSTTTDGGDVASGLYGGSDGKGFLAQANYNGGSLTTWKLPVTSATRAQQTFKYTMPGPGPKPERQDAPHLHSAFADPTGEYLFSADLGADLVRVWRVEAASGLLTECPPIAAGPGDGPRHGVFTTLGGGGATYLYVVNELGNSVSAYAVSYPAGGGCVAASHLQTLSTYPANATAPANTKAAEIHVRGGFLYASNRNDESFGPERDSIAVYAVDEKTGELAQLDAADAHGFFPRTFSINGAGDKVAVGGQTNAAVSILGRDAETGALGPLIASLNVGERGTVNGEDGLSAVIWTE